MATKARTLNDENDIVCNPESKVRIVCLKEHTVKYPDENNRVSPHTYKIGDIYERKDVYLRPKLWALAD